MRGETSEQFQFRMDAKSAEQRRFAELERVAAQSQVGAAKRVKVKPIVAKTVVPKAPRPVRERPAPKVRRPRHTHCTRCGVQFKRSTEDIPGARRHIRDGLCARCISEEGGQPQRLRRRPDNCVTCTRPLRDQTQHAEEFPGTILYGALGRCITCYNHINGRHGHRQEMPEHCLECERPLWGNDSTKYPKRPGAVQHAGKGYCGRCRRKRQREGHE